MKAPSKTKAPLERRPGNAVGDPEAVRAKQKPTSEPRNISYHLDAGNYSLKQFQQSLASRQLIPSRRMLKEDLGGRFAVIKNAGVRTIGDLIAALKNKKKVAAFAVKTGLGSDYLTLLKREASSYFPNPVPLGRFSGIDRNAVLKLEALGIKNSKQLFDKTTKHNDRLAVAAKAGLSGDDLNELAQLSDLTRLYGVGPTFARVLYDVGIDSVEAVVRLGAEEIIRIYEEKTKQKADFSVHDIQFTLEIARALDLVVENGD